MEFERAQQAAVANLKVKIEEKRRELMRIEHLSSNPGLFSVNSELQTLVGYPYTGSLGSGIWIRVGIAFFLGFLIGAVLDRSGAFAFILGALFAGLTYYGWNKKESDYSRHIEEAKRQRMEYIRACERKIQAEQAKQFDPISPKLYIAS